MKILNGKELASFIKARQAHEIASLKIQPKLLIIRDNDSPVISKYVELKNKYGQDIGVSVEDFYSDNLVSITNKIQSANADPTIHGIIIQLPLLHQDSTNMLCDLISPEKDVDGLSSHSHYDSATATAILWLLAGYDINLTHQKIALVGRGKLVGAPLEKLLKSSHYDVTVFHRGDDLTNLKNFDIIISATGVPGLISDSEIKPGAILIDAGTASEGGLLKGDLADELYTRTDLAAITPIKGGVGPLTVTCLFDHVIRSAKSTNESAKTDNQQTS